MWRHEQRHDFDVVSLVLGLILIGVAVAVLSVGDFHVRWVLPGLLIALGAAGLGGALRGRPEPPELPEEHQSS